MPPPEPLTETHDIAAFSCGKPALDLRLKTRALDNRVKGFTAVTVVHVAGRVVGYYGLAPTAIVPAFLPRAIRTGQPPDPVRCRLLGQLATGRERMGRGIGTGLVKRALLRCVQAAARFPPGQARSFRARPPDRRDRGFAARG